MIYKICNKKINETDKKVVNRPERLNQFDKKIKKVKKK